MTPSAMDRSAGRWCTQCGQHGGHHTDRHADFVCSCGNWFDGDNFCMRSACQWEGIAAPSPADLTAAVNATDRELHDQ